MNMAFGNYSGLKVSPDFQSTEELLEVFYKSSCSSLINTVMIYLNFRSNGSKLESVTWKFNKNRTPSQVFFKEFHYKSRTSVLKIASWWLLLGTTFFWKFFWMAASQGQLQRYTCLRNSKLHIFYISYCDVMLKRNEFSWIFFR